MNPLEHTFCKFWLILSCSPDNFLSNGHPIQYIPRDRSCVALVNISLEMGREIKYCPALILEKYEQAIVWLVLIVILTKKPIWINGDQFWKVWNIIVLNSPGVMPKRGNHRIFENFIAKMVWFSLQKCQWLSQIIQSTILLAIDTIGKS